MKVLMLTCSLVMMVLREPDYALGFYVPGVAPVEFVRGQKIEVKAVKMTSSKTQLPYQYYSLQFCLPKNGTLKYKSENLGEVLRGDRIVNTPYDVRMAENIDCKLLCNKNDMPMNWDREQSAVVAERIRYEYFVHLLIDNLPVGTRIVNPYGPKVVNFEYGYRLGYVTKGTTYINNHLKLILSYHMHIKNKYRVVGFEVETSSIHFRDIMFEGDTCNFAENARPQLGTDSSSIIVKVSFRVRFETKAGRKN